MTRTIITTNATMVVKDINGTERTVEKKFIGSGWTPMKIMKVMKTTGEEVFEIVTTIEKRKYEMSDEDFVKYATLVG